MPTRHNLNNYTFVEQDSGELKITHDSDGDIATYDPSTGQFTADKPFATEALGIGSASEVTGGPMGDAGERVDLVTTTYGPLSETTTSGTFDEVGDPLDRGVADYSNYPITNVDDYEIRFAVYIFREETGSGTAELRTNTFGTAPSPVPGLSLTAEDGEDQLREVVTTSIDPDDFGVWTPYPEFRATDTGEAAYIGFGTWTLTGVVQ